MLENDLLPQSLKLGYRDERQRNVLYIYLNNGDGPHIGPYIALLAHVTKQGNALFRVVSYIELRQVPFAEFDHIIPALAHIHTLINEYEQRKENNDLQDI